MADGNHSELLEELASVKTIEEAEEIFRRQSDLTYAYAIQHNLDTYDEMVKYFKANPIPGFDLERRERYRQTVLQERAAELRQTQQDQHPKEPEEPTGDQQPAPERACVPLS